MKFRLAKKIMSSINTPRQHTYSKRQIHVTVTRYERTTGAKKSTAFWSGLMSFFGPVGRAKLSAGWGSTGDAFALLMETPEDRWRGDYSALDRFVPE